MSRIDHSKQHYHQTGFTLIEVMLVIVIMAVIASLIVVNVQGVDHRRVVQAKEFLILDLQRIRLEAVDQGRVLGLLVNPATDLSPATYQVVEYVKQYNQNHTEIQPPKQQQYVWQIAKDFKQKELPEQSNLIIQALDHQYNLQVLQNDQQLLPKMIWLGNGEVIPVRLQLYMQHQPIGDAIEVNRLGLIVEADGN